MPASTMREESAYPLPEDVIFDGRLNKVEVRTIEFTRKRDGGGKKAGDRDSFDVWEWEFVVTQGDHAGIKARGTTEDHLNNLEEPRGRTKLARPWCETLLGRQIAIGENFDTDTTIVGLPCRFTVKHGEPTPKKDGGFFYPCDVEDVFPAPSAATAATHDSAPPF